MSIYPVSTLSTMKQRKLGLVASWTIQRNVISALIYRELMTRLSLSKYGIIGIFIEPLGILITFVAIFSAFRQGQQSLIDISLSLFIGIILYTLFKEITLRSLRAMRENEAVFIYRPVRPADTIIARTIVEAGLFGILYIIFIAFIMLINEKWMLENTAMAVSVYLALTATALGIGLSLMVAGHRYQLVGKIVPIFMRPLFITSGILFPLSSIPQPLRPWVSWNPILQAVEISRHAFTSNYSLDDAISLPYLFLFSGLSCALGFVVYINNELHLMS